MRLKSCLDAYCGDGNCRMSPCRWRELLLEKDYNDGKPITEEWFTVGFP